jgi:hypothetical protein
MKRALTPRGQSSNVHRHPTLNAALLQMIGVMLAETVLPLLAHWSNLWYLNH